MTKNTPDESEAYVQLQDNLIHKGSGRSFIIHAFLLNLAVWITASLCLVVIILEWYGNYGYSFFPEFVEGWYDSSFLPSYISWHHSNNIFIFSIVIYIIYLIEALAASTPRYLWNLNKVEDIIQYINRLKTYPPQLKFHCTCYHYETRTRWVTEYYTVYEQVYDSQAKRYVQQAKQKSRQKQETYQETVVTHREEESVRFSRFDDTSGDLSNDIYKFQATRVSFSKNWNLANEATTKAYNTQKSNFQARNENRDRCFKFWESFEINNFKDKALSIVDLDKKSPYMSWIAYFLFSLFMLSWPYRKWFELKSVKGHFQFQKIIYV